MAGPFILLKLSVDLAMPWQGIWALAVVIGTLPVAHVLLGNRHDKQ
ncbi:hypothetical protein ACPXCP_34035 [Streptomyces sp. DT20]